MEKCKDQACGCEADLKKEVDTLVENVEGYSEEDHNRKREEINVAFSEKENAGKK